MCVYCLFDIGIFGGIDGDKVKRGKVNGNLFKMPPRTENLHNRRKALFYLPLFNQFLINKLERYYLSYRAGDANFPNKCRWRSKTMRKESKEKSLRADVDCCGSFSNE